MHASRPIPTLSRRGMLGASTSAAAAVALGGGRARANEVDPPECVEPDPDANLTDDVGTNLPPSRIGVQTYSVNDQISGLGLGPVLTALAEIGYRGVEFAGLGGATADEARTMLDDLGMHPVGQHAGMDNASLQTAVALGLPHTGISLFTNIHGAHTEAWKQTAEEFNAFGAQCAAEGVKFYVHMHPEPYTPVLDSPGNLALDVLLAHTDPGLVFFEMDLYWAYFTAMSAQGLLFDPVDFVLPAPERFPIFHVKDGRALANEQVAGQQVTPMNVTHAPYPMDGICDVGQGDVPFKDFFGKLAEVSDLAGHELVWERDTASNHPRGSLASARASYLMMRHDHMGAPSLY